ncbi:MAG: tRNA (adenosine(37)-N6)-threonylcarbamoyltransferase complex ATPase subunit type 1 TsaE [Candidatus Levybacteria bacterium RBG_16_35_11]|nr:MAG: tRNA (adenosine(37)-N6)-threonylcarbamoyltransferase complex ATPase subunit type 1 TsaE [Candidatus Levybacteria bacterium RBG_16_35_11]
MKNVVYTNSSAETIKLGEEFSKKIKNGGIILLYGELGAGKTTFVQGLARGLGIKRRIISPTFIIIRTYKDEKFYHIDLYRVEKETDMETLGIKEILKDSKNVIAIEWPEKIEKLIPKNRAIINFQYLDENKRRITYG